MTSSLKHTLPVLFIVNDAISIKSLERTLILKHQNKCSLLSKKGLTHIIFDTKLKIKLNTAKGITMLCDSQNLEPKILKSNFCIRSILRKMFFFQRCTLHEDVNTLIANNSYIHVYQAV